MRQTLAIALLILAGCCAKPDPKPSVTLPAGTKIIGPAHSEIRGTFRDRTDYWRLGSVVELSEPLVLTTPE